MSNRQTFEYGGYHFTPYRQFEKGEDDFFALSRRLEMDRELGLSAHPQWQKFAYNYDDFYAAATDKKCDVFRCEENGRVYVPGARELFLYHEPQRKKSIAATLSQAKKADLAHKPVREKQSTDPER